MEVKVKPEPMSVELSSLENVFLKAAVMSLMGAITLDPQAIVIGAEAGTEYLQALGREGLQVLATKLDAHRVLTKDDGSIPAKAPAPAPAPAIITLDDVLPEPTPEGNDAR